MKMMAYEQDPDVMRWGLHHLMDVCSISNGGSPIAFTQYETDLSSVEYVSEGYCEKNYANVENDEMIACALQEELARLETEEKPGSSGEDHQKESVLAQHWLGSSKLHGSFHTGQTRNKLLRICQHILIILWIVELVSSQAQEGDYERGTYSSWSSTEGRSGDDEDQSCSPEMADESTLDGEVGKRINQMVPIRHVPKVNGEVPSADEATSDRQRLMNRLQVYDLVELKVSGDGNCQFRSLSDQIYRSSEHHKLVREQIVQQLKSHPELYAAYVPMAYDEYLKKIRADGEWGDHVTLQAAADAFGVKIFVLTSFKDTCYIEILPCVHKSDRIIFLSFWAEVHYNSIYPEGELPVMESRKKKKWWMLGS